MAGEEERIANVEERNGGVRVQVSARKRHKTELAKSLGTSQTGRLRSRL